MTSIIATVSPAQSAASETLSTLRFATDAKMIKNAAVRKNDVCYLALLALYDVCIFESPLTFTFARYSNHTLLNPSLFSPQL